MINSSEFVIRLKKILAYYGFSAAAFADKIGVQRSSISHLLSGRNKPSLEFVLKVVQSFPEVNLYWLLNGKGSFPSSTSTTENIPVQKTRKEEIIEPKTTEEEKKAIDKIIIFYTDGSFNSYHEKK